MPSSTSTVRPSPRASAAASSGTGGRARDDGDRRLQPGPARDRRPGGRRHRPLDRLEPVTRSQRHRPHRALPLRPPSMRPRSERLDPRERLGRQRRQHLGHRRPEQRVPPVRRDLGQRRQHEAALLHPRMRQHRPGGAASRASPSRAIQPRTVAASGSTASPLAIRSRSQTRGSQRPARRRPSAASTACSAASTAAGSVGRLEHRGAVDEVRARPGRPGRRAPPAAARGDAQPARRERGQRRLERRARRAGRRTADSRRGRSGARCRSPISKLGLSAPQSRRHI